MQKFRIHQEFQIHWHRKQQFMEEVIASSQKCGLHYYTFIENSIHAFSLLTPTERRAIFAREPSNIITSGSSSHDNTVLDSIVISEEMDRKLNDIVKELKLPGDAKSAVITAATRNYINRMQG